ncbi:MAG: histone deacetylase [Polyangiaceae bacterium]|nr:histone deacetylase [Polyangiaceae bacterium]
MKLEVFYCDEMVAHPSSFSPSAGKPAQVVDAWRTHGLPIEVVRPSSVGVQDLHRAHDPLYVDDVLALRRANGFGDRSAGVASSLAWTSGAMLSAARRARATRSVAVAPCSGFHHAGWDRGAGFCTFNGLMVAALALRELDGAASVGILDCDMHEGDGTDDIRRRLGESGQIRHFTAGATYHRPDQAASFLARLPAIVASMSDCDVLLYQAGADPHVQDPLGGWLTDDELRRRDEIVFESARRFGLPVAWNLAGGYQRDSNGTIAPVLAIHVATARACVEAYGLR